MDGTSEIDAGFEVTTKMKSAWPIDDWNVIPDSSVNGEATSYTFSITTTININSGDYIIYSFPPQTKLPDDLVIKPVPRLIGGEYFSDELTVVKESGSTVKIIFVNVIGSSSDSYKWIIEGVSNPPSTQISDPFTSLIGYSSGGFKIIYFQTTGLNHGPKIQNITPGTIVIA